MNFAAYEALTAPRPGASTAALRRRLLRLSVEIQWHPHWSSGPGASSAGRVELRRLARASVTGEVSLLSS
ncbi:hypothetical protein ACH4PU_35440 [Streptomyces sp. NPDC021100]|uniref:hypothetical protein n=1 Tax=Streptomyces sp. NPDC021100 TaxID=3365114 RepID=UPI0037A6E111